ncbi:unnamed protein product [Prunus armeniaca]
MVLRCLENQGSRSPGGTIEADKTCVVEPDWGKWLVKSAFRIVKYGGLGLRSMVWVCYEVRGITSLNGAWDPEATWHFNHSFFGRVFYGLRLRPSTLRSRGREDSAFTVFLLFQEGEMLDETIGARVDLLGTNIWV